MNFPTSRLLIVFLFQLMVGFSMAQNQKDPAFWLDQVNAIHANPDYYWNEKLEKVTAIHDKFLESNDKNGIYAKIIHRMGDYHRILGEFPEAISLMQEAIAINKSNAEHAEEFYLSFTYCNIGIAYQELGLQEKAELYYDSALFLHRKFPAETFPPAYISFDRKTVYTFNKGEYQRTVDLLDYAFGSISGLDGTIEKNLLLIKKARALLELEEFEQAEKIYLESIGLFESGQYSGEYPAFAYNSYGIYLARSERPEEAEQYFDKSIQIYLGLGALGNVLNVLDELYFTWAKKDDEKALTYLNRARKYLEPYPDSKENLVTLNHMGRTLMRLDRFDEALQLQQEALRFAVDDFKSTDYFHNPSLPQIQQTSSFMEIAMILKNKGETLLRKYQHNQGNGNELDHALSTLKLSDKVIDLMRWDQQAENTKAYWRASTKSLYEMALEAAFNLNDQQAAFYFMEKSRAVMLNDQLSEMGALKFLTEKDLYQERQLKTEALSMKNLMLKAENGDAAYQKASVDWFEAQSRYESFIKELEKKYPNYYQYKYDTTVLSLSRLQGSLLSESQAYLSYFVGEESTYLFYAAKDQSGFEKLASTDLKDKADQLLGLVSDRNKLNSDFKNFQKMSFQLYADLIPVGLKGYDRLIVSPDEFFIPFELLMTDSTSKNAYLLQSHALSYTYSAGFLAKNKKDNKNHKVFGLAPVEYKAELQQASLLGADLSLKRINKFFPSNHFVTYEKATKQNFLDNLSHYSIAQLYSHAVADAEGIEPRLYFYDESMPLSELQLLGDLSTQLIVLAACNTGVGKNISGEGIFSLARGFAAAGIPSSITTLWEVE
ncbi:MAG: CHAT domain-containing protein, partial [Mongoliibacter sp.]|uniref:CHAT domain-containing protein n=1 Tax=Mongoliibacter sp. TaxID=2022438 RepID=UPI0012F324F5